jgi:hypothetical protein
MSPKQPPPPAGAPPFPFPAQEAMDFMQKLWNPFGVPIPGFAPPGAPGAAFGGGTIPFPNPAAMFATLDPAEIERKIGELKVIEGWLTMSLNLMQMSIRTMELQKASLEALRSPSAPPAPPEEAKRAPKRRNRS